MAIEGGALGNVIATSKLAIPTQRRALVRRADLVARLDEQDYRVALVAAPAGYGKTATVGSWAAGQAQPLAWFSCDAADAEPTRFMAGMLAALSARWPGVADDATVLLERDGSNTLDAAVAVANELGSISAPGVIVVDDLHLAKPAPDVLAAFFGALPEHFRIVVGSRTDLPVSMARLRLQGGLLELRSDDLRFSADDTAAFCELRELPLDRGEIDILHHLTEGWPAGAQLAALALQRGSDRTRFLDAFARTDRTVGDFLVSEVLDKLAPELVDFLIDTSVLDAFDAELCAAVSGREDAALLLERLIAADLFVVPLDERGEWNRYHHLFGSFLRARLASFGDARRRTAHGRASVALAARGDFTVALQQAMAVGDLARVGQVLRSALDRDMSMDGVDVTLMAIRSWLHEFGPTVVATSPVLVAEVLLALISVAAPDDAIWWLRRVEDAHPHADAELTAVIQGTWSEFHVYNGRSAAALERGHACVDAVDGRPPNKGLLPLAFTVLVRAHLQGGDMEGMRAALARAAAAPSGNAVADTVRLPALAALLAAIDGELGEALQLEADVRSRADRLRLPIREPGRIWSGLARVEAHLERNELQEASTVLDEVVAGVEAAHRAPMHSQVALVQARVARARDDAVAAEGFLAQAEMLLRDPDAPTRSVFVTEAVQQALRFDPGAALALIDALDPDSVETQLLRVRLSLIEGQPRTARAVLDGLAPATTRRLRVQRRVLHALVVLDVDVDAANEHLQHALTASHPERLIRSIIDPGPDVHRLLHSCTPDVALQPYLSELISASGRRIAPQRVETARTLVEPLSAREVTVLRYLCSRLTYEEIAAALYVSVNTLKSHVKSVYRKLEVASRADAVEAGRTQHIV